MGQLIGEILITVFALIIIYAVIDGLHGKRKPSGCFGHYVIDRDNHVEIKAKEEADRKEKERIEYMKQHREDYTHPDNE